MHAEEKKRGNKLLTVREALLVSKSDEDLKIEIEVLTPGWKVEGSKTKVKNKEVKVHPIPV